MTVRPVCFLSQLVPDPGPRVLREFFDVRGGLEDRPATRKELLVGVRDADALYCLLTDRVDDEVLAGASRLRVVSVMAVGYDNVDVEAANRRGVLVTHTPGVLTETTADLVWALLLAAARRVPEGDRLVRSGEFRGWEPNLLLGGDVFGKVLGVVGMGRIGTAVARRALGFGMPVRYTRESGPLPPDDVPAGADWQYRGSVDRLLEESDIVSLNVPLTEATRHLIGERELRLLGPEGILINTARGPVVDEGALVEALRKGIIAAAGLDVYEDEPALTPGLAELDNVVLLPHLGSATRETRGRMAELAARNAIAAVAGRPVPHPVNPQVLGP